MCHITRRLTAKNRDQLGNPTLGNRVWATSFTAKVHYRQTLTLTFAMIDLGYSGLTPRSTCRSLPIAEFNKINPAEPKIRPTFGLALYFVAAIYNFRLNRG